MPRYNIYNSTGGWLGVVNAESEQEALKAALEENMADAQKAEEKPEHQERG